MILHSMQAPIFIVGCGRSGTTMLRLMLNEHPEIHIPNESWFLPRLWKALPSDRLLSENQLKTAHRIITNHWRWQFWEVTDEQLWSTLKDLDNPSLVDVIGATYEC